MSDRPRWERVVAVFVLLLVIAPFVYFAILRSQQKTIGVDFARVGEVYQRNMLPGDWKLVQTYDLTIMGRSYRLYHYDDPGQMLAGGPFFTIGDEYGVMVDSQGLITEIINGDDALHHRLQELERQHVLKK